MTVKELTNLAQIRAASASGNIAPVAGYRSLEGYCQIVAGCLREALFLSKHRPAKFTGKESPEVLRGRGDRTVRKPEDEDDYVPTPGDPTGYGAHIVDAIIVLVDFCRSRGIDLDAALERRLRRYDRSGK